MQPPLIAASRRIGELCDGPVGDDRGLRQALIAEIQKAVPFDAFAWLLTDPVTCVGASPLAQVPFFAELPRAIRLRYLTDVNRWSGLEKPAAALSAAADGELDRSVMWRDLLRHYGIVDAASVVFRDRYGCWGFLELWRSGEAGRFSSDEVGFLSAAAAPITSALRRQQAHTFRATTSRPAQATAGPVVLLLSPGLEVRAQTAQAESYLRTLLPPDPGTSPVPAGAYNVAAQLLAIEAGVDDHPSLARVHLGDGVWLTMKAARIAGAGAAGEADIAVSIELASTQERAALFARAHALTEREAQLLEQLSAGADTRGLAAAMHLSEHTVQDHLKSVFAKTGTHSRRQLLSVVTGI